MDIKNIVFDNGGVLSVPSTGHWFITPNFFNIVNNKIDIESLKNAMKKYQNLLTMEPKTELEEYEMFSKFYYKVLEEVGYENLNKDLANKLAEDCVYNNEKYTFFDEVNKTLGILKQKYNLYIISDAWPSSIRLFDELKLSRFFKDICISSMESTIKLERLFEVFLKNNIEVKPKQTIFIDDRIDILEKANSLGFNVLLMDRENRNKKAKYKVINDLNEIINIANKF